MVKIVDARSPQEVERVGGNSFSSLNGPHSVSKNNVTDYLRNYTLPSLETTGASSALPTTATAVTVPLEDHWIKTRIEKGIKKAFAIGVAPFKISVDFMDHPRLKKSDYLRFIPFSDKLKRDGVTIGEIIRKPFAVVGRPLLAFAEGFIGVEKLKTDLLESLKRPQPLPVPDMDDAPRRKRASVHEGKK